ncbi:hybrid sensor histidine kinase/response regulator [Agitococcus lubricus]|uniref:Sensory/regulatory protein RpfC n=1 Tax=Agitococcus lubricus TaxID=1077255 RepID=A0A2T5J3E7_9GAMM|nr:hybrid sensor histidine kinase/response regulator [Agitococcus lubricus]PTQ91058.1 PAS/PAC sensor hybrid histidine kinase [Agitococcus lubricus]
MIDKISILIVEDEQIIALDLQQTLEQMGYDVLACTDNGTDAIQLAQQLRPSVVLMDILLKGAMDGTVAGKYIGTFGIPVIYLTAFSDSVTVRQAAEALPYGFLTKPYRQTELGAAIEVAVYKAAIERKLTASERWSVATLRCVGDGVVVMDQYANVGYLNPVAERLTGWTIGEAKELPICQIIQIVDKNGQVIDEPLFMKALQQNAATGLASMQLKSRSGQLTPIDYLAAPIRDDTEDVIGIVIVLRDMTERVSYEQRLLRSEAHFRHLFEYSALGMMVLSLEGDIQRANTAFLDLLGYQDFEIVGLALADFSTQDEQELEQTYLADLYAGLMPVAHFEKRFKQRHGEQLVWTLVHVTLLRDKTGKPESYLYQVHDLSDRLQKRAMTQRALMLMQNLATEHRAKLAAEAENRAKSDFLATVSHELRTPLNGVIGFNELLLTTALTQEQLHYVELARLAGETLLHLINDVLDLSKIIAGKLEIEQQAFMPKQLIDDIYSLMQKRAKDKKIQLIQVYSEGIPPIVLGDPMRIKQILLNLLSNAIKFTHQGQVTLALSCRQDEDVYLVFQVSDTGIGIEPSVLPKLFQPFTQADISTTRLYGGTGLGLAIVKRLTELMSGHISVASEVGRGTVFSVEIPVLATSNFNLNAPTETVVEPIALHEAHILVAEDNIVNQQVVEKMLEKLGCHVSIANTGLEAIHILQKQSVDLLLLDCQMPVMDGFDAARLIRANPSPYQNLPIIALTAGVLTGDREKCLAVGMNDYLTKPIRLHELKVALQRHLVARTTR